MANSKKIRSVYISDEVWELLKKIADKENRTISNLIEVMAKERKQLMKEYLEKGE